MKIPTFQTCVYKLYAEVLTWKSFCSSFGIALLFIVSSSAVFAQSENDSISLEYCYAQIEKTYPLMQKYEIQQKITALNKRIARSGIYPEIQLSGSASYQSDVTEVPFSAPGSTSPEFSKDHYNLSLDVTQTLFDGGRTKAKQKLEAGQGEVEDAGVKAELWNIRRQAEQVYFGILLLQKNSASVELLIDDIEEQLAVVQSKVENGVLLPGNALAMEAELLKIQQQKVQVKNNLEASFEVLSEIIGTEIPPQTTLKIPQKEAPVVFSANVINRPELEVFSKRKEALDLQKELTSADRLPNISAFGTAAYGRPGLNVFEDDLQSYWMVGVRAQWSFRSWNNSGKKAQVLELQKKKLRADEEAFRLNVRGELSKSDRKINQLRQQIDMDEKVLDLREQVVEEKQSQLEEGVITSTEYLTELHEESQARLNLEIRKVQLVQAIIEYSTKQGKSWN